MMMKALSVLLAVFLLSLSVAFAAPNPYCSAKDSWAYSVVDSSVPADAGNALGETDGSYVLLNHFGASPDYVVLDMGVDVCNGPGDDLSITFALLSPYPDDVNVYVSSLPDSGFEFIGTSFGWGSQGFDIGSSSYKCARYVRIVDDPFSSYADEGAPVDSVRAAYVRCPPAHVPEFGGLALVSLVGLILFFVFRPGKRK